MTPVMKHDGLDRQAWHEAHDGGISASMICKAMTPAGRRDVLLKMLNPHLVDDYDGNERMKPYMQHGTRREEEFIGEWIESRYGVPHNVALWAHEEYPRFLATPDGWNPETGDLAEFKTSTTPLPKTINRSHRWQMQWQMWVMGSRRCLYVHEQHSNFTPVDMPKAQWVERDEHEIEQLVSVANGLLFQRDLALS